MLDDEKEVDVHDFPRISLQTEVLKGGSIYVWVDVEVLTGHSRDVLPFLARDGRHVFGFVFMDQRGSRYEEDLESLEEKGLLHPEVPRNVPFSLGFQAILVVRASKCLQKRLRC